MRFVPGTLLPGDTHSQDPRLPALLLSCSSRTGKRPGHWEPQVRLFTQFLPPCLQGSGKPLSPLPHCPRCPSHGRAQQREEDARLLARPASGASSAVCWFDSSRQLLAVHSASETKREVREAGPRDSAGETWGSLSSVWVQGLGRFDLSVLTELGPRSAPCPAWRAGAGLTQMEVAFPSWPEGCETARGLLSSEPLLVGLPGPDFF